MVLIIFNVYFIKPFTKYKINSLQIITMHVAIISKFSQNEVV